MKQLLLFHFNSHFIHYNGCSRFERNYFRELFELVSSSNRRNYASDETIVLFLFGRRRLLILQSCQCMIFASSSNRIGREISFWKNFLLINHVLLFKF